jgi:GNAT superfamily N-acetyltransferase
MHDVLIRPYEALDREGVFQLAADTAFFGRPLETYLDDRRLFCDAFYSYYTDFEPEHAWVASVDGVVVGFLMGCVNGARQRRVWLKRILPRVARQLLQGRYKIGVRTWRHALRLGVAALQGRPHVSMQIYPAHLHLNVASAWRREGIGRRLLLAFLQQMRNLGVTGVHANSTSLNREAGRLFESMGFRVADSRPTRQWSGLVPGSASKVCYVLGLKCSRRPQLGERRRGSCAG